MNLISLITFCKEQYQKNYNRTCVDREAFPCKDLPRKKCFEIRDDEGLSDRPSDLLE